MKYIRIIDLALFATLSLLLAACSQEADFNADDSQENILGKEYVYNMHFDGEVPGYSDVKVRATTSWASGSVVYLWFKNGTSYIFATATYTSGKWVLSANEKIPKVSSNTECKAVYVTNPTSVTSTSITLSSRSIYNYALGSYTCSSTDIYVKATLKPKVWRLRFKGTSGQKITLPSSDNDIKFYSKINLSNSFSETTQKEDITLTVNSNGYTDYIYGMFTYPSGSNKLYVKNETEGKEYYITSFSGSKLALGKSGYLTIPTSSNYSSNGWKRVEPINQYATLETDAMYVLTNAMVTMWKFGSSAYKFYYKVYPSYSSYLNDDDGLVNNLKTQTDYTVSIFKNTIFKCSDLLSNTSYYLCAVAYDVNGNRGPIFKKKFTTRRTTDPIAKITSVYVNSSNKIVVNITKQYGANKFYCTCFYSNNIQTEEYAAWSVYYNIDKGYITTKYSSGPIYLPLQTGDKYVCVMTVAVDSYGTICNYDFWQGKLTTNAGAKPVENDSGSTEDISSMKISELNNMNSVQMEEGFYVKLP